ncbi:hypothetical protein O6H91_08G076100 [Diphasiastrum complanatum]|uniref:Uncharacterized protein n=3 Tax=Diphasiastrum complanatum TaxID=34168 RepID=A0ACC2CZ04_DIPCM|nr:hypothetical protein O6H91_08G076100 [Diphasiastrum complanatum]
MVHIGSRRRIRAVGFYSPFGYPLMHLFGSGKCLPKSNQELSGILEGDEHEYNEKISAHVKAGRFERALMLYHEMKRHDMEPTVSTYVAVLDACAKCSALSQGKLIHAHILKNGVATNPFIGNTLVNMYAKCGLLEVARKLFDKLLKKDVVSWSTIISAYALHGDGQEAFRLLEKMQNDGYEPNKITFMSLFKACGRMKTLDQGKQFHTLVKENGLEFDQHVASSLIGMYAKCGSLNDAWKLFQKLPDRGVVPWTSVIAGFAQHGRCKQALQLFETMQQEGIKPDRVTYVSVLQACAGLTALDQGKLIHAQIAESGLESDLYIANTLIDMYAKCGRLDEAHKVFLQLRGRDVVSWTALIAGYAQLGRGQEALELFKKMQNEGVKPNKITFLSILKACSSISALDQGRLIHAQLTKSGYDKELFVSNTLLHMYAKCGCLGKAWKVFYNMSERDVVSYSVMIAGLAKHGKVKEALSIFERMMQQGVKPDKITYVNILKACGSAAALDQGKLIHRHIMGSGIVMDVMVGSAVVDMYAKCGSLGEANQVFENLPERNVVSWNALIAGHARHGHAQDAIKLFEKMQEEAIRPNHVTFIAVLSACSWAGLVNEGYQLFQAMCKGFNIIPTMKHYACMVDLLGRTGNVYEALDLINKMPVQPGVPVWMSLLGACRTHGNLDVGKGSFESILKLDPTNNAAFGIMSNIYSAAGHWKEDGTLRLQMKSAGAKKLPGRAWIESNYGVEDASAI